MKKILALLLALMMLFSVATVFAGCEDSGSKKSSASDDEDKDDEDKDDEDKDDEDKDDEDKDDEDKDDEDKDDEDKDDEDKDDEDKDDEDKDNEDKDDEDKDNEDKDNENEEKPVKPSVDAATLKELQDVISETLDSTYGFGDEINMDLVPEAIYEYIEYLYDYTKEDLRDGMETYYTYIHGVLESSVGGNLAITSELKECTKMSEEDLVKVGEGMELAYGDRLSDNEFTEGYFIVLDMAISGDDDSNTSTQSDCAVVCYDGQWYFISCEVEDDTYYCDFIFREALSSVTSMLDYPEYYQ